MTGQVISKIVAGDSSDNLISNSTYLTCATAAGTAAKIAKFAFTGTTTFTPIVGTTIIVKFIESNTADNATLTLQTSGGTQVVAAKNLCRYGTTRVGTTVHTSWQAGGVVALTYDGTS